MMVRRRRRQRNAAMSTAGPVELLISRGGLTSGGLGGAGGGGGGGGLGNNAIVPVKSILPTIHHPVPNHSPRPSFVFSWSRDSNRPLFPIPPASAFLAGAVAGAASRTVVSPLERLKILLQIQGPSAQYKGILPSLTKMWKEEGFRGYMRGNGVNVLRIAPYSAVQFSTYELFKGFLTSDGADIDTSRRLIAGSLAGISSVISTYPLDLVRSRLSIESASLDIIKDPSISSSPVTSIQNSTARSISSPSSSPGVGTHDKVIKSARKSSSILGMTLKVYREEGGMRGLYRGLVPTAAGVAPYVGLNFACYELFKIYLTDEEGHQPGTFKRLCCGAAAGSISQTLTYPLDVLRRRMQVTGMAGMGYKYTGSWDAIRSIIRSEGFFGLYKGIVPNLIKVAPSMATSFAVYERTKEFLDRRAKMADLEREGELETHEE